MFLSKNSIFPNYPKIDDLNSQKLVYPPISDKPALVCWVNDLSLLGFESFSPFVLRNTIRDLALSLECEMVENLQVQH